VALGIAAALLMGRSVDVRRRVKPQSTGTPVEYRSAQLRVFVFVAVSAIFGGLISNGITVAMPKLFEEQLGSWSGDIAHIGLLLSVAFAMAAFAQLPIGALLDRHGARPVALATLALQVPLLVLIGQVSGPALLPFVIVTLLLVFGGFPVTDWLIGRYVAGEWQSRVYAVSYLGALGVTGITIPAIAFLHDLTGGFALVFVLLGAAATVVCASAISLPAGRMPKAAAHSTA
jgi:MFS family permease